MVFETNCKERISLLVTCEFFSNLTLIFWPKFPGVIGMNQCAIKQMNLLFIHFPLTSRVDGLYE